jgi:2-dehydropantoate 2-reductase
VRIAILGTGAMGSVYAALMAHGGLDVWAVDTWADHIDAINRDGLHITGASGEKRVRLPATTHAARVGKADLVIIATKADNVEAAAAAAKAILSDTGVVLTIQNGLGSADKVAAIIGKERLLMGVVGGFGASIPRPGHVHHNGWEFLRIGEYAGGPTTRAERVADTWRRGGFKVHVFNDIHKMVWEKFICNVAFSGSTTLTGLTIGEVCANPDAWKVASGCAVEAFTVARAKGIKLDFDDAAKYVRDFGAKIPGARPSMLLDHMAGRRSEIAVINGAVPVAAASVGLEAPMNATVTALIMAREAAFK